MKRNFQVRPFGCNFLKKETRKAASEKVCALQSKKFHGNIKMSFMYICNDTRRWAFRSSMEQEKIR